MNAPKRTRNDAIIIAVIGALTSIFGGTLPIDIGGGITLTSQEAWKQGIAPTMVVFGLLLVFLSYCFFRGKSWIKWPIVFWLPLFFLLEAIVVWDKTETTYQEFLFLGLPVLLIWLWCSYSIFKRKETIKYLSNKNEY